MKHIAGVTRCATCLVIFTASLFAATLPFTPRSTTFWLISAAAGTLGFLLLWLYWRRPSVFLFAAVLMPLLVSRNYATQTFFPLVSGLVFWLLFVQFLSVYFFVQLAFVRMFGRKLLESTSGSAPTV